MHQWVALLQCVDDNLARPIGQILHLTCHIRHKVALRNGTKHPAHACSGPCIAGKPGTEIVVGRIGHRSVDDVSEQALRCTRRDPECITVAASERERMVSLAFET